MNSLFPHGRACLHRAFRPAPGLLSLCLALCITTFASADPTIALPATAAGDVNDFIEVPATTNGISVQWYSVDATLKLFPISRLKDTKTAVVIGKSAGSFKLLAWTGDASGPSPAAVCIVTVGAPTPPDPPVPPVPPSPPDPLGQALAAAYALETDTTKAAQIQVLAGFYRGTALTTVNDPSVLGTVDLAAKLKQQQPLSASALPKVRGAIETNLNQTFSQPAPLDAPMRKRLGDLFTHIADLLGGLK